eukprot:CAMPEP_0175635768 /NCGR_PEP_ID=MMETSP0097-20121207/1858_1 /TAXON_ID=311494 /ORGANISM="Alexandrium monilatum, Strain CCMP3105" /LENGTH=134 /DNA_ID=CAMNT_0016941409 /DNA_START=53 /DNA_END=453 /DNA_ORIENTATION=+
MTTEEQAVFTVIGLMAFSFWTLLLALCLCGDCCSERPPGTQAQALTAVDVESRFPLTRAEGGADVRRVPLADRGGRPLPQDPVWARLPRGLCPSLVDVQAAQGPSLPSLSPEAATGLTARCNELDGTAMTVEVS